ncbi:MAG: cystatin domain-containing protein [Novosphingobium sp.]
MAAAVLGMALSACAPAPAAPPVSAPVIVGGWDTADPASEAVQNAARYAVTLLPEGQGTLAEVRSAQTQVVAGVNFRMVLRLANGTMWEATVWHKLDGSYALSGVQSKP